MSENYEQAAHRHFRDAEYLAGDSRWGNAAHLVGFAAECAIKHRIHTLRVATDVPHGHFPEFRDIARRHFSGRRDTMLHSVLKMPNLLNGWHVALRYERDSAVKPATYEAWRKDAARLFSAAGLRR